MHFNNHKTPNNQPPNSGMESESKSGERRAESENEERERHPNDRGAVIPPSATWSFIEHNHPRAGGMTAPKGMAESERDFRSGATSNFKPLKPSAPDPSEGEGKCASLLSRFEVVLFERCV